VEVLEDDQEGLILSLAQEQVLDRIQGPLPPLRRVKRLPLGILDGGVEKGQERREDQFERAVQGQQPPGHLLSDVPIRVAVGDPEIALEQIDDGQVAGGLAVGDGTGLEHEPALDAMGVGELEDQPRLPDAGLPHNGRDLPAALTRLLQCAPELLHLSVPPHEAREPPRCGGLEPRPDGADSGELIDLDGGGQPPDRHGPQGRDLDKALGQCQRVGGQED
jgi:hypothetical protein